MTQKDYVVFATMMADVSERLDTESYSTIYRALTAVLAKDNSRFNVAKFAAYIDKCQEKQHGAI
jgi:hypothetical protein